MDASSEDEDAHFPSTSDTSILSCQKEARSVTGLSIGRNCNIHGSAFVKVINTTTFGIETPESEGKLTFQVKDPIISFTGRKRFLRRLHKNIQECRKKEVTISVLSQTSSITGLGGIGKSETARMYIKQYGQEYDNIVWIDAEHPSETAEQFKSLAGLKLNISLKDQDDKPRKFPHILEEVYDKLCRKPKRLLIVFDNAEALDDSAPRNDEIRQFHPPQTTTIEPPIILITSRQQNWKDVNVINLGLWNPEECMEYILKELKLEDTEENRKDAHELAELFDRLTIAIQVAVSVILEQSDESLNYGNANARYCIQNLISDYRRGKTDFRDEQLISIHKLLDVSFDKLKRYKHGKLAIRVLAFMAYLSPTKIPKEIIQWLLPETDEHALNSALNLLTRYSIVQKYDTYFTIHRVFQSVVITKLPNLQIPKAKFIPALIMCSDKMTFLSQITNKFALNMALEHSTQEKSNLITNIIHTAEYIIQHSMTSKFYNYLEAVAAFVKSTQYEVAIMLFMTLIDCDININKLPPKAIFNKLYRIGIILYRNARYKNACEIFNTLLHGGTISNQKLFSSQLVLDQGLEKILGAIHSDTLKTKHYIALCLCAQGRIEEALNMYYVVLEAREKVPGARQSDILTTKNNIAACLSAQGKNEEALNLYYIVLEAREKLLGPLHPDTLSTKNNISMRVSYQGQHEEARKLYNVVLEAQEKVLGVLHPTTLKTKHNIAACLINQGHKEEALKLYYGVLEAQEKVLGALHPDTLRTKHNIASCLSEQNKKEEALKLYYIVLEGWEKVLGALHPDTFMTKHNIAACLSSQGQKKDALNLYYIVLEASEKVLGALHPSTLTTKHNTACCLSEEGKMEEALKLYYVVLEAREKVLGSSHPSTLRTKANIDICVNQQVTEMKHEFH